MKNTELKALIKGSASKGMRKPELFALLHNVLAPEPLERFAGWVRHLEHKFASTDLIYRYTGGVGASVRFYIRTNGAGVGGSAAISFKVENDTWVIPDDLPQQDRTTTHEDMRQRDNVNQLKLLLQKACGSAAGRFNQVERVLNKALDKAQGATDFVIDRLSEPRKLILRCNGGKNNVVVTFDLNQRDVIADHSDRTAQIEVVRDRTKARKPKATSVQEDYDMRKAAWAVEEKEVIDLSIDYAEKGSYKSPSKELLTTIQLLTGMRVEEALSVILTLCPSPGVAGEIQAAVIAEVEKFKPERYEERVALFMPLADKFPWLRLFVCDREQTAIFDLFFRDDVLVDHRVAAPTREQRVLGEMFDPSTRQLDLTAQHSLAMLAFNCVDPESYQESYTWVVELTKRGCWGLSWFYAASENGDVVITISPDYSQYEKNEDTAMSFTYDGGLRLIRDELVEEPAAPSVATAEEATAKSFSFGDLGRRLGRPEEVHAGLDGILLSKTMSVSELCSVIHTISKPGAATGITSALVGRVGYNNADLMVSLHLVDPQVLEIRDITANPRAEAVLRVSVDTSDYKLVEAIRPYGLPLDRSSRDIVVDRSSIVAYISQRSISPECANRINDAVALRTLKIVGLVGSYRLAQDEHTGRVIVTAISDHAEVRIVTIGLVNGLFADPDRDSAELDALLAHRGERTSRFADRPSDRHEAKHHMAQPDQEHVREVAEAPAPVPRVFPLGVCTRVDHADRDTALDFIHYATAGMPQWTVAQALQFVMLSAANIKLPDDTTHNEVSFTVVLGKVLLVQAVDRSVDPMIVRASLKLPRN